MQSNFLILADSEMQRRVINKPNVVARFPFLQTAVAAKEALDGCGECKATRSRKSQELRSALAEARTRILQMPDSEKEVFKQLVGAETVRVSALVWKGNAQVTSTETF